MALTAGRSLDRRGAEPSAGAFAYSVAASHRVYRGGFVAVTAAGVLVRVGQAGAVRFVGIASRDLDNTAGAAASVGKVTALKGTYPITVPAATAANINDAVYATDDNTATLTVGTNLQIGTIAGIENGQTYVKLLGS